MNMSIRENIQQVRENIAAAALSAGRRPEDITLVGASKMNDAAACREAIAAGIDALGENRVQEMTQKLAENAYDGAPLHFIGHLQRNKVKQVVGKVALIESVGSYAARCPASWQATPSKNGQNNPPGSRHSQQQPRTMAAGVTLRRRRGDLIVKDGEGLRDRAAAAQGLVKAADGDL